MLSTALKGDFVLQHTRWGLTHKQDAQPSYGDLLRKYQHSVPIREFPQPFSCNSMPISRRHRECRRGRVPDRLFVDRTCIKAHRTAGGAEGGLGQWCRPDTRRQDQLGRRHLRRTRMPKRPDGKPRKSARHEGRQGLHRRRTAIG